METKQWIYKTLIPKEAKQLSLVHDNELASDFLLVWGLFEKLIFKTEVEFKKIYDFSKEKKDIFDTELDSIFNYFYNRYKNKDLRSKLCNQKECSIDKCQHPKPCYFFHILDKKINEIEPEEKLFFITYVTYRYRKNIITEYKNLNNWLSEYEEQISYCINTIKKLTELNIN